MENINYSGIEEFGFSAKLYNKFKRAGINTVGDISKFPYSRLLKTEVIELLKEFAVYRASSLESIEDFGCSEELYLKFKKLGVERVQDIPKKGYDLYTKPELIELFTEFAYFDSHQADGSEGE